MRNKRSLEIPRTALRLFGYQLAFGFIGFMAIPALLDLAPIIRIPLIGAGIAGAGMLLFMEGSFRGERDVAASETLDRLSQKGTYHPTEAENAKRYKRSKGVWVAVFGALPVFLIAVFVALTATPYVYTPQDLPSWLTPYMRRPEIGSALAYVDANIAAPTVTDYLRIAVRFALFPFLGFFGGMSDAMSLTFDRISPLLALVMPALAAIGYQFGPRRRAKSVKMIEEAKRRPKKRLTKEAKKRLQQKKNEPKQLI